MALFNALASRAIFTERSSFTVYYRRLDEDIILDFIYFFDTTVFHQSPCFRIYRFLRLNGYSSSLLQGNRGVFLHFDF